MNPYIIRQLLVIVALFFTGAVFNALLIHRKKMFSYFLYAFPTGLALFGMIGFGLLIAGIHYDLMSIGACYVIVFAAVGIYWYKCKNREKPDIKGVVMWYAAALFITAILAYICCSGIIGVSVSNDSYYYYSVYPQTIVTKGEYLRSFDVFLTDVGQSTAVLGTLPFLFGFEETFGIQLFLGFNLAAIFAVALYERAAEHISKRDAGIFTVVVTLGLITATPYVVMTRWILANVYFMAFLFILFVLTIKLMLSEDMVKEEKYLLALYMAMLSMTRMEGGMMACLLILSAAAAEKIKSFDLSIFYLLPVAITQSAYYAVVYLRLKVDPLYSFLNYKNVFVMLGLIVAIYVYLLFMRDKIAFLKKYYAILMLAALAGGNAFLAIISSERYIGNLGFFVQNILLQNGWGFFGLFLLVFLIMISESVKLNNRPGFEMIFTIGFVLFTVAVCWARNGSLRLGIGDSGNRVLMQVVPFVIYTIAQYVLSLLNDKESVE